MPEFTEFPDDSERVDAPLETVHIDPDAPDEIAQFVEGLGLSDKFRCLIRKVKPGGTGGYYTIQDLKNVIPTVEQIGKEYGPGAYAIAFTWYPAKGAPKVGGKAGSMVRQISIELPEIPWKRLHNLHIIELERSDEEQLDKLRRERRESAATRAIENGRLPGNAGSTEDLLATVEKLRALGIQVGQPSRPAVDWEKILAAAAVLLPTLTSLFKRESELSTRDLITMMQGNQQTLVAALTQKSPVEANMLGLLNTVVDTARNVMKLAPGQDPVEEKESWADRVFGLLESIGPQVLTALAQKPVEERRQNMLYKMAAGSEEIKTMKEDPERLIAVVNRLDQAYGYEATNEILESFSELDLRRPPETEGNREKFPTTRQEKAG